MYLLGAGILTVLIAAFVVWPHLHFHIVDNDPSLDAELNSLLDERERILRTIKDLELDFQMGKISTEDHASMKARGAEELTQVLSRLDSYSGRSSAVN